ncbi:MAG: coproporphyrinogen dehydrogenase HemZ [Ruminococcus sp.]|jgi:oxygen-independent coproporphyrinogen-3 oxidase|nr:coproporphyrinogen dehydrogenase HemZ [Ruminococcus sp.]
MTLTLDNPSYKYEIEAVLKIFFPQSRFVFAKTAEAPFLSVITEKNAAIKIDCGGKIIEKTLEDTSENAVCREIYNALSSLTGQTSPWGIMTGIRPVKKVNDLLAAHKTEAEIREILREKYLLSDEKFELLLATANVQKSILKPFDKRAFSLYVGIPFCPSRCSYCSFVSHSVKSASAKKLMQPYAEKLCLEIAETAKIAKDFSLKLQNIYVGGGTPTAIKSADLDMILSEIAKNFDISAANEYTVEAGRADTISPENLEVLKKHGATRISINPQTMNDSVLAAIGRNHTSLDVKNAFFAARAAGFDNINTDLITGLPTDTPEGFMHTLDEITALSPESITVHTLTLKRSSSLFSQMNVSNVPVALMTNYAEEKLPAMGYSPYYLYRQKNTVGNLENVGFAKKGFENLYNVYIMEETQTILSAGAGGSTKLVSENGRIERVFNYKYPYEYVSDFGEILSRKNTVRKFYEEELSL